MKATSWVGPPVSRWSQHLLEALTLVLMLGLFGGTIVGLIKSWRYFTIWEYTPAGSSFLILDTVRASVNKGVLVLLALIFVYLSVFFAFHRTLKSARRANFLASAITVSPVFLFWAYLINRAYLPGFFELKSVLWNFLIGLAFVSAWLLIATGLFSWSRVKILGASALSVRKLAVVLGLIALINLAPFFSILYATGSPNIIILLVDALRADRLSYYGYDRETTPNIDRFAKESVIFSQAVSQGTFTKTSVASLFTSLYPHQHGVYTGGKLIEGVITTDTLSEEETTLAETLLRNGFLTVAWIEQEQLSGTFAQGFIDYHERQGRIKNINERFMEWAERIGPRHSFFAYLHYIDLHGPYRPQPPYDTLYGKYSEVWSPTGGGYKEWRSVLSSIINKTGPERQKDVNQLIAYYDGQLTYIDSEIGTLLEGLKEAGLYDNSLIILTADHGDGFLEHGFFNHSNTPYEELIRVPLIVHFPGSRYGGRVVEDQVGHIDAMPTILDFLKVKIDSKLEGISLLSYLDDHEGSRNDASRYVYSENEGNQRQATIAVRTEQFKYIHFQDGRADEFYDLKVDPREQNNIITMASGEAQRLRELALGAVVKRKQKDAAKMTLNKKAIEELKALGYVGN